MNISTTKIETLLAERGMTKAALSESCGISRQNISTIIRRGTCEPKTAGKLALGLGVPVSELIEEVRV
ncbi:helix-turn-helix transcriptional regulator [Lawsonibacter sp. OA9]|uniref:helix-turn-helix domain-containing protein n=1 Tax=Lawsonibacter sp. OA9 TaxID=2914163 RepID=UPI001F059652|nr:helix-turn-helix transcriptional regulator [Lawsonibacter sp. OA9]MCH1979497.1 helix-turn-helix transcriptional regulator [Lawsonibacter sp. OA9]